MSLKSKLVNTAAGSQARLLCHGAEQPMAQSKENEEVFVRRRLTSYKPNVCASAALHRLTWVNDVRRWWPAQSTHRDTRHVTHQGQTDVTNKDVEPEGESCKGEERLLESALCSSSPTLSIKLISFANIDLKICGVVSTFETCISCSLQTHYCRGWSLLKAALFYPCSHTLW